MEGAASREATGGTAGRKVENGKMVSCSSD